MHPEIGKINYGDFHVVPGFTRLAGVGNVRIAGDLVVQGRSILYEIDELSERIAVLEKKIAALSSNIVKKKPGWFW